MLLSLAHSLRFYGKPAWVLILGRAGWRVISPQARSQDHAFAAERTGPDGDLAAGGDPLQQVLRCGPA
jgi:hypothetical protein